ncbi:MAG TPA: cation:proton antiporter [Geminicoccaceae bacterium]|nr:cation:proton antiporter [Geminicoccaceae bacterium]
MNEITALVFGIAGLLLLISFLPPLARRLRLPDTVLLAALGCALGLAIGLSGRLSGDTGERVFLDFLGGLGEIQITSHLFLAVFLPILLFETALKLDGRALLEDLGPVLVMAVIAVVATTVLAGAAVWAISGFSLIACMLVAAIIATTDPVAVVAVFREVGAPRRLTLLVEGESLLNDAAAIALFGLLLQLLIGQFSPTPGALVASFLWDFVGGAAFGALAGRLAAIGFNRLDEGGPAEVTLSVALAYLTYAIAETYVGTSGVVAVVLAGLVYGDAGRARLSAEGWQALVAIWSQMAFWASSLIFVLASMLVPATLRTAGPWDLVLLAALILGALAARALILFGVLPIFGLLSPASRVGRRHKLVMLWGGLRGAVTLALALGVRDNPAVGDSLTHLVSVLATGFVLFTLLVQATTLRPLIHRLKLDQLGPAERMLRERAFDLTQVEILDRLRDAAAVYDLDLATAEEVGDLSRRRLAAAAPGQSEEMLREQLVTALATLAQREIDLCVEQLTARMISRAPGQRLIAEARALLDALRSGGVQGYRDAAKAHVRFGRRTRFAALVHRHLGIRSLLARRLAQRTEVMLVRREVLKELQEFARGRFQAVFGERVSETAGRVLENRLHEVERALDALQLQYPDYWRTLSGRHLSRVALRLERDGLRRMAADGLLTPEIQRHLLAELQAKERAFESVPRLDLRLDVAALVRRMPLFAELGEARLTELGALLTPRLALPGERVVHRGRPGDAMYFIASGAVEVVLPDGRVRLGTGEFFGELALLTRQPRAADVVALGYCKLLVLARASFSAFLDAHPEVADEVRRIAAGRVGRELVLEP